MQVAVGRLFIVSSSTIVYSPVWAIRHNKLRQVLYVWGASARFLCSCFDSELISQHRNSELHMIDLISVHNDMSHGCGGMTVHSTLCIEQRQTSRFRDFQCRQTFAHSSQNEQA